MGNGAGASPTFVGTRPCWARALAQELTCLDLPPRGDASQQGQYLIQLLDWGMDKDSMWDDPEHPGHKQPLVSRAIVAGMSQVTTCRDDVLV